MKLDELVAKINLLHFFGLRDFDCGSALTSALYNDQEKISKIKAIKNTIGVFLKTNYHFDRGNDKIIVLFATSYCFRDDYNKDLKKVLSCISSPSIMSGDTRIKFKFNKLKGMALWITWNFTLMPIHLHPGLRITCCNQLLKAYYTLYDFKKYRTNENVILSFCDFFPEDSIITQFANTVNMTTGTLQHAVFNSRTHGFSYKYSYSDYFLGISEFAKREAYKSGYCGKDFLICGPMKMIDNDTSNNNFIFKDIETVGVLLSGGGFDLQNKVLIDYAGTYAKNHNKKIRIRFHPVNDREYYKSLISQYNIVVDTDDMNSFIEKCDLFLVGISNTFADLIYLGKCVFRLILPGDHDFYEGIESFKFSSLSDLETLFNLYYESPDTIGREINEIKHLLLPEGSIKNRYIEALEYISSRDK